MFNFLFRKRLRFDPTLGDRLGQKIAAEAQKGRFSTLIANDSELRSGRWDERTFYIGLAAKSALKADSIELPNTPLGHLIMGCLEIERAWGARGGGVSSTVSDDGWQGFFKHLQGAAQHLQYAGEQDQADPTAYAFLQPVAMGLQLEHDQAREWLEIALDRDPYHKQAHSNHLFLLCKKWGGSHDQMFDFARATVAKSPSGSVLKALIYAAYQEYYLYLWAFEENEKAANEFIFDPAIRNEALEIYNDSLAQRPQITQVSDYWHHNLAMWWFYMQKNAPLVRAESKKIGDHMTEFPWRLFFNGIAAGYELARDFGKKSA